MRSPETPPERRLWTTSDGYSIHGRLWASGGGGSSLGILYLHGTQSHGGWFEWSASVLASVGCPVLLPDRRGSGLNEIARGDTPSRERWLADIDDLTDWMSAELGVERFALVGISWGGKLAAAWALRRPERTARVLLVAPGLFPAVGFGFALRVAVGWSLVTNAARTFPIPLDDPALFTANSAGQQFILRDPLKLRRVTARFLHQSVRLDRSLVRTPPESLKSPATLVLAENDRIIRNEPTESWLRRMAGERSCVRLLEGVSHTVEFEPEVADFRKLLSEWATGVNSGSSGAAQ